MKHLLIIIISLVFITSCNDSGNDDPSPPDNRKPVFCLDPIDTSEFDIVELPADADIFLIIGQSNAAGRGKIYEEDLEDLENVYLLIQDNKWIKAKHIYNQFSNIPRYPDMFYSAISDPVEVGKGLNFAFNFAKEYIKKYPDKNIGLIVNARGSTDIESWQRNNFCYECTMKKLDSLPDLNRIKAILVHQGETDFNQSDWVNQTTEMVAAFRDDLWNFELPFIFGELAGWNSNYAKFNSRIYSLYQLLDNIGIVSSEDLTGGDIAHFDRASQLKLGKRYFEMWEEITG